MKKLFIILILIIIVGFGWYFLPKEGPADVEPTPPPPPSTTDTTPSPAMEDKEGMSVIGKSVEGRDIAAYIYGTGDTKVLFIGGIHGGYSWNTALVAYELMDYLEKNPAAIPAKVQVTVIPVANPDGLSKVVATSGPFVKSDVKASQAVQVSGRYNAHTVDLNRNFDCDWQPTAKWQSRTVSGGSAAFSEPESLAIKNYIEAKNPAAVVVWYSAAGGVFSSSCSNGILPETTILTNLFAKASGYPAHESFDFYETTGDMANWLAKNNIPAISVLLTDHTNTEWTKNEKGVKAVLNHYAR